MQNGIILHNIQGHNKVVKGRLIHQLILGGGFICLFVCLWQNPIDPKQFTLRSVHCHAVNKILDFFSLLPTDNDTTFFLTL